MNKPSSKPDTIEQQLRDIAAGIITNVAIWPVGPGTSGPNDVILIADQLHTYKQAKETADAIAEQTQAVLEQYVDTTAKEAYTKNRDQAYSSHGRNNAKLKDYNLNKIKEKTSAPPATPTNPMIIQSNDGTAFINSWAKVANAKTYEVWYAASTNAADDSTIPEMHFLATSTKASYTHIGIVKGSRYFYAVKSVNASGKSELSPVESRVAN